MFLTPGCEIMHKTLVASVLRDVCGSSVQRVLTDGLGHFLKTISSRCGVAWRGVALRCAAAVIPLECNPQIISRHDRSRAAVYRLQSLSSANDCVACDAIITACLCLRLSVLLCLLSYTQTFTLVDRRTKTPPGCSDSDSSAQQLNRMTPTRRINHSPRLSLSLCPYRPSTSAHICLTSAAPGSAAIQTTLCLPHQLIPLVTARVDIHQTG